jgi:hypothetical protein
LAAGEHGTNLVLQSLQRALARIATLLGSVRQVDQHKEEIESAIITFGLSWRIEVIMALI